LRASDKVARRANAHSEFAKNRLDGGLAGQAPRTSATALTVNTVL
jgi:hypothetical protein